MEDSTGFEPADSGFASHSVRPLHHESMLVCVVGFEPTAIRSRSGYSDLTELHTDVGESSGNRTHGRQGLKDPLVPINLRPIVYCGSSTFETYQVRSSPGKGAIRTRTLRVWQTCRESNPHGTFWRRSRFLSTSLCCNREPCLRWSFSSRPGINDVGGPQGT